MPDRKTVTDSRGHGRYLFEATPEGSKVERAPFAQEDDQHAICSPRHRRLGHDADYSMGTHGIKLLRDVVGRTITALEAVIVARDDVAWGTVRIHAGDAPIDVTTALRDLIINDEGDTEEFGVLAVAEADPDALRVDGVDEEPSWCDIGADVAGVMLVNGHVTATEDGTAIMERAYTQAIVFALARGGCLVLDKGAWFSEMITIGMGDSWEDLVYDDSQDWEDDPEEPEVHYGWKRSMKRL
ncbi:MAG: hypothetical protein Q4A01_00890 [Coriobacteriales bacterium]|nr:hypothetical protein [Coriobacteriales bacterium]